MTPAARQSAVSIPISTNVISIGLIVRTPVLHMEKIFRGECPGSRAYREKIISPKISANKIDCPAHMQTSNAAENIPIKKISVMSINLAAMIASNKNFCKQKNYTKNVGLAMRNVAYERGDYVQFFDELRRDHWVKRHACLTGKISCVKLRQP